MRGEILGKAKTVRELLKGVKYSIDYYQREYKWHDKQIRELIDDLSASSWRVRARSRARRSPSIRTTSSARSSSATRTSASYIVDGQQRLTSLTLLLIFLRNLQRGAERAGQRRRADLLREVRQELLQPRRR